VSWDVYEGADRAVMLEVLRDYWRAWRTEWCGMTPQSRKAARLELRVQRGRVLAVGVRSSIPLEHGVYMVALEDGSTWVLQ
jgi:hypothetical protein